MKHLICDVPNLFWRAVSAQQRYGPADASTSAGLGLHMSLMSLRKYWLKVQPDKLAIVFEGKKNWRKEYTRSEECYSKRLYKGNRVSDPGMAVLFDVMCAFEDMARQHTSIVTLTHPEVEGDDLIAGYTQHYTSLGDDVTILSGDKDFVQLLTNEKIHLLNPDDGKERTVEGVCGVADAGYFMFEKCFRGDAGDNVLPALPRVRATKLHKAYGVVDGKVFADKADAFVLSNLLNSHWEFIDPETGDKRDMLVEKMFEENNLLMNLTAQPDRIRTIINDVIAHESTNHGKFDFFKFNQFLGKYELAQIAERASDFVGMFSGNPPIKTVCPTKKKKEIKIGGFEF